MKIIKHLDCELNGESNNSICGEIWVNTITIVKEVTCLKCKALIEKIKEENELCSVHLLEPTKGVYKPDCPVCVYFEHQS